LVNGASLRLSVNFLYNDSYMVRDIFSSIPHRQASTLFGYVRGEKTRYSVRLIAGNTTWEEYERLGLEPEHFVHRDYMPEVPYGTIRNR